MTAISLRIPTALAANCRNSPERTSWMARLPATFITLKEKWDIKLGQAFDTPDVTASFIAPAECSDGTTAILKIGMPHFEALHEIDALRLCSGDPTVRLLEADTEHNAMLLERCEPGTPLRDLPLPDQDKVVAKMLRRFWRTPQNPHPFRPLSALTDFWIRETESQKSNWPVEGLVREALRLFHDLPRTAPNGVLLATDLHAGNVLRSQREPWLVIDPKPFVGDPTYDATQHLFNNFDELSAHPLDRIHHLADLLDLDPTRLQQWLFARLAAGPRDDWHSPASHQSLDLARKIAL